MNSIYVLLLFAVSKCHGSESFQTLPYVFPMRVGQTYDATFGGSIIGLYEGKFYDKLVTNFEQIDIKSFGKDQTVNDYLMAGGHIGLGATIQGFGGSIKGGGAYSKRKFDQNKVSEWLGKISLTQFSEAIANPMSNVRSDCQRLRKRYLGTHYIRSVTYGRDLVLKATTKKVTTLRSQTIDVSVEVGVTAFMVTASVGADYTRKLKKTNSNMRTDIALDADGEIPFLPVDLEDCGAMVDEWARANANRIGIPKKVEIAQYDIQAVCKPEASGMKIPTDNVSPEDTVTQAMFKIVELRLADFKNAVDRIQGLVSSVDFDAIGAKEEIFLKVVYGFRWDIVLNDLMFRSYIEKHVSSSKRNPDATKILSEAENTYMKNIKHKASSWEDSVLIEFENSASSVFCPRGFIHFNGICYYFSNVKAKTSSAKKYCGKMASELLYIRYMDEYEFLLRELEKRNPIGQAKKTYHLDGYSKPDYSFVWGNGRPINVKHLVGYYKCKGECITTYDCIVFKHDGRKWTLQPSFCGRFPVNYFICSRLII